MQAAPSERWLGRADVPWNILLTARLVEPVPIDTLHARLRSTYAGLGWSAPADAAVLEAPRDELLTRLAGVRDHLHPVSVGRAGDELVIRGDHGQVDGLGMLALLRDLAGVEIRSTARGVGDRQGRPVPSMLARRLGEAVFRPPAEVVTVRSPGHASQAGPHSDTVSERQIVGRLRTANLVRAAVGAIVSRNESRGRPVRRLAVAVGVSTAGGADLVVADRSGFLRLRYAERLGPAALSRALAEAPLELDKAAIGRQRVVDGAARALARLLADRLGSTVLVSHLGTVHAPGVAALSFFPVSVNGSGLSLGAVHLAGRTTITLRARGHQHASAGLDDLLADVVAGVAASSGTSLEET